MGTQPPPKKGTEPSPQFSAHFYCGQTAGCTKMPLGMGLGLSPLDFVLNGYTAPPQRGGGAPSPIFSHVYCGQTAGWIKMALGMEVGLGPCHIVLDGEPAPLPKRGQTPNFRPCIFIVAKSWMHQDGTWYGCRPQPRRLSVRWGPSFPAPKGAQPSIFVQCPLWPNNWMDEDAT